MLDKPLWDPIPSVLTTIDFYAEHGDVQNALYMALVLGDRINLAKPRVKQWTMCYLELLQRLQLWVCAAEIIQKSKDEEIKNLSKINTTVYTSCPNCKKSGELLRNAWYCENCKSIVSQCSLW